MAHTSNVDPQELHKFATAAHHWWNIDGEFKSLHAINPLRMSFICDQLELAEKKVIDVGCGGGILTESLARAGANITGIDMTTEVLTIAQQHAQENNLTIEYQHIAVEIIAAQRPEYYDVVTCMEMLEHVPDPIAIVKACSQLVKPGGKLFFSTLNRNLKSYLFAILGAEYVLKLLPKGTHDYSKFIKPAELVSWARAVNLTLDKFAGIEYNPFTQNYRLTEDVAVNYLVSFTK